MLPKVLAHKNLTDNELSEQGLDGYSSSPDAHPQTPSSVCFWSTSRSLLRAHWAQSSLLWPHSDE